MEQVKTRKKKTARVITKNKNKTKQKNNNNNKTKQNKIKTKSKIKQKQKTNPYIKGRSSVKTESLRGYCTPVRN